MTSFLLRADISDAAKAIREYFAAFLLCDIVVKPPEPYMDLYVEGQFSHPVHRLTCCKFSILVKGRAVEARRLRGDSFLYRDHILQPLRKALGSVAPGYLKPLALGEVEAASVVSERQFQNLLTGVSSECIDVAAEHWVQMGFLIRGHVEDSWILTLVEVATTGLQRTPSLFGEFWRSTLACLYQIPPEYLTGASSLLRLINGVINHPDPEIRRLANLLLIAVMIANDSS